MSQERFKRDFSDSFPGLLRARTRWPSESSFWSPHSLLLGAFPAGASVGFIRQRW